MRSALALAITLLMACSSGSVADEDNPFRPGAFEPRGGEIEIFVNNLNFADATLLALHEGGRTRLGTVGGKSSGRFRIQWQSPRDLRIQIDLLAGDNFTTLPISAAPGDQIGLTVETVLGRSQLTR
jgi:hypothetical protein